jgi:hypothetical protein
VGAQAIGRGGDTVAVRRDRASQRERTLPELDAAVVALARAVERHGRRLGGHDEQVREVASLVEHLAGRLTATIGDSGQVTAGGEPVEGPVGDPPGDLSPPADGQARDGDDDGGSDGDGGLPSWLVITDWEQAEALIATLAPWVQTVYLRWPYASLPSCWALHPWAVEELWTLRCAWFDARAGAKPSWLRWQDWHDRQRPSVARRLREGLDACSLLEHEHPEGPAHPALPGAATLPQVVTAWATGGHQGWPPSLAEAQLAGERRRRDQDNAATATRPQGQHSVRRSLSDI